MPPLICAPTAARLRGLALGSLAGLALTATACGSAPSQPVETAGAPPVAVAEPAPLPTLPPVQEQAPERFDDSGCVRVGPAEADCASTASAIDAETRGDDPADWRRLAGFEGRHWAVGADAVAPTVLTETVSVTTTGPWTARGLARNDTAAPVGTVVVTADLLGADGTSLETVTATSPVAAVRPGEPVPFVLTGTVDAAAVTQVRWTAAADDTTPADPAIRDLAIGTYWTRDPASGRPVDFHLHTDVAGAPLPYLLFGSVQPIDGAATPVDATVVATWLDTDGRVVLVAEAATVDGDVLVRVDDPADAAIAAQSAPMLWGALR